MAKLITVEGVEGRVAYSAPSGGKLIPVGVPTVHAESKWLKDRLTDGDIVISKKSKK